MLQEGIFWKEKSTPGKYFGILFLELSMDSDLISIDHYLNELYTLCTKMKKGFDPYHLDITMKNADLNVTIGYGQNVFDKFSLNKKSPEELSQYGKFRSPKTSGGGLLLRGSKLKYLNNVTKNVATEDVVLQFTANTILEVNRSILNCIELTNANSTVADVSNFYTGFHRDDKRSWIGFHDGISNLKSGQDRLGAIQIKPKIAKDEWTVNGTYLYFLRIHVDVNKWNSIDEKIQELLVGRKKISGCPISNSKNNTAVSGCPFTGTETIVDRDAVGDLPNKIYFEPPIVSDEVVKASHVQRVNQHVEPSNDKNSLRIFRQGYEFFEHADSPPGYKAGLNFVSFQDSPDRVTRILTQPSWMGNINFGGLEEEQDNFGDLLKIESGGIYIIPPVNENELYPGQIIFKNEEVAAANIMYDDHFS